MRRHIWFYALGSLLLAGALAHADTPVSKGLPWRPTLAEIKSLEPKLVLPNGAQALNTYVRFYAGALENGVHVVFGEFVAKEVADDGRPSTKKAAIRILQSEDELPGWKDGGCGIIRLKVDFDRQTVLDIACNGDA
jgi:hypothetical protein